MSLVFNAVTRTSIPWYIRLILWFKRSRYAHDPADGIRATFLIRFKTFRGVTYVLGEKK